MENWNGGQRPKSQHDNQDHATLVNTHAVFAEKVLAVTPSTVLDAQTQEM